MKPTVQISLDLTNIEEAIATAHLARRAGVDWLEAGTPLILAEGLSAVRRLREEFPEVPIVADLKTMDGGHLEAEMMAQAGATRVDGAKRLEDLGCDFVIHHIGYDERRGIAARGARAPNPLDELRDVVQAVDVPVQAVGGLSLEQAISCPRHGAPLVVLGASLVIDSDRFQTSSGDVEDSLRKICDAIHDA